MNSETPAQLKAVENLKQGLHLLSISVEELPFPVYINVDIKIDSAYKAVAMRHGLDEFTTTNP